MPIMYRCPGELRHIKRGFTYDQREMADSDKAKAEGWFDTLEEAAGLAPVMVSPVIEATQSLKGETAEELQEWAAQRCVAAGILPVRQETDDAKPTRDEMLKMAEKYGIDVDKRWGDKRLAAELDKAKAQ